MSKAPALISDSMVRLLSTAGSTRSTKSWNEAKTPFLRRSSVTNSTTPSPTFRIADNPNGIDPLRATKSDSEAFTSGTSTRTPMVRHSLRYTAVRSLSRFDEVSRAAMYSAG